MRNVGLIGLGAMGLGMAQSLRRAGHRVHVCDVRAEAARAFAAEGGVACGQPRGRWRRNATWWSAWW
jgi:3-hydroxyisobutyrate dehydrogenase